MSKPKFKLGDKVRILDGSKIKSYICGWSGGMKRHIGEIATIKSISQCLGAPSHYRLEGYVYNWDERGLELVKPEKIIIYRNGADVVAKNTATGKTGVARCNPADEFDFHIGAKLAFERLINPEPVKPKYYTGKVVCIDSKTSSFTEGKIYVVTNGNLNSNDGVYEYHRFTSFADIQGTLASEFIELVE